MIADLPNLPGLARHGSDVRQAFARACAELGYGQEQADALAAVIEHESGWRADAVNPSSGATGLIQFMPSTAKGLGTSVQDLRAMNEIAQLPFVVRYLKPLGPSIAPRDIPIATFLPSRVGHPDDEVTFARGAAGYDQNAALDLDHDGRITLGEVRTHALKPLVDAFPRGRLSLDTGPTTTVDVPTGGGTGGASGGSIGGGTVLAMVAAGIFLARKVLA